MKNRTGDWYFGVVALTNPPKSASRDGSCADLTKDNLNYDFNETAEFPGYEIRMYTGGCYYFNTSIEEWEGVGITVGQSDFRYSRCLKEYQLGWRRRKQCQLLLLCEPFNIIWYWIFPSTKYN